MRSTFLRSGSAVAAFALAWALGCSERSTADKAPAPASEPVPANADAPAVALSAVVDPDELVALSRSLSRVNQLETELPGPAPACLRARTAIATAAAGSVADWAEGAPKHVREYLRTRARGAAGARDALARNAKDGAAVPTADADADAAELAASFADLSESLTQLADANDKEAAQAAVARTHNAVDNVEASIAKLEQSCAAP